jgi:hypothetical protein
MRRQKLEMLQFGSGTDFVFMELLVVVPCVFFFLLHVLDKLNLPEANTTVKR